MSTQKWSLTPIYDPPLYTLSLITMQTVKNVFSSHTCVCPLRKEKLRKTVLSWMRKTDGCIEWTSISIIYIEMKKIWMSFDICHRSLFVLYRLKQRRNHTKPDSRSVGAVSANRHWFISYSVFCPDQVSSHSMFGEHFQSVICSSYI